jgi:hypothetical protein
MVPPFAFDPVREMRSIRSSTNATCMKHSILRDARRDNYVWSNIGRKMVAAEERIMEVFIWSWWRPWKVLYLPFYLLLTSFCFPFW